MNELDKSKVIRDAATVVLLREISGVPHVLMGQRGANAAFMPNKYVFPGGAVDTIDHSGFLDGVADTRLGGQATGICVAALRELLEETGLRLPPRYGALRFIFRAITPPGRPRRFDARFFMARASDLINDPDNFSNACDELSHLHWIALGESKTLELPFITSVVLAEVSAILQQPEAKHNPPFFYHEDGRSHFALL
ncbi:MAG: NUDIX hydrolase [Rhodobacteraceae bacterium]|nr:NUDIX hydrolase [Paracoccaceae bacterium]